MVRRTLVSSFLTFLILFAGILIFEGPGEFEKGFVMEYILQVLIYGGCMITGISFAGLLLLNLFLGRTFNNKNKRQKEQHYFAWSAVFTLVPILCFALFDYINGGQFGYKSRFTYILSEYGGAFIMALIAVIINRKLVWNNFRENKQENP